MNVVMLTREMLIFYRRGRRIRKCTRLFAEFGRNSLAKGIGVMESEGRCIIRRKRHQRAKQIPVLQTG